MYYYAFIDPETSVCLNIEIYDTPMEENPYYILLDSYDESLVIRKKYVDGVWVDTTADEAARDDARHFSIGSEWLDDKIYDIADDVENHTHDYATASTAGFMSASDKSKLDGIASGANVYTLPSAGSSLGGVKTGGDVTISGGTITVNDDSHNHVIANVDGLQSALDAKATSSHTHTAASLVSMADALFCTNASGGVEYSYGSDSGKNVLTEISNMPQGFHTIYAIAGTTGNPETSESYRYFIHKTSTTIGWFYAFGADGSIYSNYLAAANTFKGWRTIHDAKRKPLWSSARYMTADHTVTPSKKLSECEHGWMLLWSDYDPDTATINDTDFCTTMIPNRNWAGSTWNGASYYCDVPRYSAGTATDSESRVIKVLTVYDNKLVGNDNNKAAPRNDVVLRAIYEF